MKKHVVTVINEGGTSRFLCPEHKDLLTASEQAGCLCLPRGCRRGGCGICRVQVIKGSAEPMREMSAEHVTSEDLKNGTVLACCVRPGGPVTVRTAKKKMDLCGASANK